MLPPANVGERPRTGPVDCLCLIIAGRRDMEGQPPSAVRRSKASLRVKKQPPTPVERCSDSRGRLSLQPQYRMCRMPRILISGASGLVGTALVTALEKRGDEVYRLVRREPRNAFEICWDPMQDVPAELVSGFHVVIHLSGETVAGRWTERKKRRIRDSRVVSTQNLALALAKADTPPQTFICASATGYYGNRGDEVLSEQSASGQGFLAETSREWEDATQPAAQTADRVVNLRIGVVLSRKGGALKQMLLPFRLGLGGKIGSGRQWFSWIHVDDLVAAVLHIIEHSYLRGPVNMVSPNPVTNAAFTKSLAEAVRRPAIFPVPAFMVRLAFGEFAEEGLLASARVVPRKLVENGFRFQYPELRRALEDLLNRPLEAMS